MKSSRFLNQKVLELGVGVGLDAVAISMFASKVLCTGQYENFFQMKKQVCTVFKFQIIFYNFLLKSIYSFLYLFIQNI